MKTQETPLKIIGNIYEEEQSLYKLKVEIVKYLGKTEDYNIAMNKEDLNEYSKKYKGYAVKFLDYLIKNEKHNVNGCRDAFIEKPFIISNKLASTYGKVTFKSVGGYITYKKLTLSAKHVLANTLLTRNEEILFDTIKHEVIHFYCMYNGLNFRDGDADFEHMLIKYNVKSSVVTKDKVVQKNSSNHESTIYALGIVCSCPKCQYFFIIDSNNSKRVYLRYRCGKCGYTGNYNHGKYLYKTTNYIKSNK